MKIPNTPSSAWIIPGILRSKDIKGVRITYGQDEIIKAVCSYYGMSEDVVLGKRRLSEIILARHAAEYLLYTYAKMTLKSIGRIFNAHHSTVITARDNIQGMLDAKHANHWQEDIPAIVDQIKWRTVKDDSK